MQYSGATMRIELTLLSALTAFASTAHADGHDSVPTLPAAEVIVAPLPLREATQLNQARHTALDANAVIPVFHGVDPCPLCGMG